MQEWKRNRDDGGERFIFVVGDSRARGSIRLVRDHQSTLLYASDRDISTMCDWMIVQER